MTTAQQTPATAEPSRFEVRDVLAHFDASDLITAGLAANDSVPRAHLLGAQALAVPELGLR